MPVLEAVEPGLPAGVELSVAGTAVAALLDVRVVGGQTLEVPDPAGTPWLRVGPSGVEVDAGVAETYRSTSPEGGGVPADVVAGQRPRRWVRVSPEPRWAWFEHRLHPGGAGSAGRWEVPVLVGAARHVVRGRVEQSAPSRGRVTAALREPAPDGLAVELLPGTVPGVLLRLEGAREAVVRGTAGEPFLRFRAGGVDVNVRSTTYREAELARGSDRVDPLTPGQGVEWQPAAGPGGYAWAEPRARAPLSLPPEVLGAERPQDLLSWQVPVEVDGRSDTIEGVTRWTPGTGIPQVSSGEGPPLAVLLASGLALTAAVTVLAWRRHRT